VVGLVYTHHDYFQDPLNILQVQWIGKALWRWQACTEKIELGYREKEQVPSPLGHDLKCILPFSCMDMWLYNFFDEILCLSGNMKYLYPTITWSYLVENEVIKNNWFSLQVTWKYELLIVLPCYATGEKSSTQRMVGGDSH